MKKNQRQRGQIAIVLLAASILFIFAFCALVVDLSRQMMFRGKLRIYCDVSASAGANLLPNSGNCGAVLAATRMYARNLQVTAPSTCPTPVIQSLGPTYNFTIASDSVSVITPYNDPNAADPSLAPNRIRVSSSRVIRNHFGQLMGLLESTQASFAVARKGGQGPAEVIFNKSQSLPLLTTGNNNVVNARAHTNQDFNLTGNNNSFTRMTYVGTCNSGGGSNNVTCQQVSVKPSPVLPTSLPQYRSMAVAANTFFNQNVTVTSHFSGGFLVTGVLPPLTRVVPNGSIIYVEGGSIVETDNNTTRNVTLIATGAAGTITMNNQNSNFSASDGKVLAHADRAITIIGNQYNLSGIIDAGGVITADGNNFGLVTGAMWGAQVVVNGNNLTVNENPAITSGTSGEGSSLIQ